MQLDHQPNNCMHRSLLPLHSPIDPIDSNTHTVDPTSPEPHMDYTVDEPPEQAAAGPLSDCDSLERMRRSYIASLDASIDLLVRNSIAFSPGMFGAGTALAAQPSAFTALSSIALPAMTGGPATVQHHWHKPQPNAAAQHANQRDTTTSSGSSRSAQFTIENLIRKDR